MLSDERKKLAVSSQIKEDCFSILGNYLPSIVSKFSLPSTHTHPEQLPGKMSTKPTLQDSESQSFTSRHVTLNGNWVVLKHVRKEREESNWEYKRRKEDSVLGSVTNVAKGDVVKASFVSRLYFVLNGWKSIWICHIVTRNWARNVTQG